MKPAPHPRAVRKPRAKKRPQDSLGARMVLHAKPDGWVWDGISVAGFFKPHTARRLAKRLVEMALPRRPARGLLGVDPIGKGR